MQLDSISCFEEETLSPIDVDRQWLEENMSLTRGPMAAIHEGYSCTDLQIPIGPNRIG